MELNPILTRESRARWRGRAFGLLLGGVALLAVLMVFAYNSATYDAHERWQSHADSAKMGAELFLTLTYYQIAGWMLLAPSLTATAIAGERERGLLEALQLSSLAPGQIVRGKLYAALTFIALLLLATQPIMAICFLMGGVSPREFLSSMGLVFLTALSGASLGLCVSAWSRRAAQSVSASFGMVMLWGLGTMMAFWMTLVPRVRATPGAPEILFCIGLLNPAFALSLHQSQIGQMVAASAGFSVMPAEPLPTSVLLLCAASLLLLLGCVPALRRPFASQSFVEIGPATPVPELLEKPVIATRQARPARGLWQLPLARWIRSRNPVLQRDLRAKFMFRRVGLIAMLFQCLLLLAVSYGYLRLFWAALETPYDNEELWEMLASGVLFALILTPAVTGATAITRERENGTWEGLRISLLTPLDIVLGKQLATVGGSSLIVLLLLPFVPVCLRSSTLAPRQMLLSFALMAATAWFTAAWGLLISSRCRRTVTATAWTVASLFILLAMAPAFVAWFLDNTFDQGTASAAGDLLWSLHPFGAFTQIFDPWPPHNSMSVALRGTLFLFVSGCILLVLLHGALRRRGGREE